MRCRFAVSDITGGTEEADELDDDVVEDGAGGFEVVVETVATSFFRCLSRLISSMGSLVCLLVLITGLLLFDVDGADFVSILVIAFSGTSSLTLVSTMITGFSVIIGLIKGELPNVELFSIKALEIDIFGRYSFSPPVNDPSIAGQASSLPTPPKLLANIFVLVVCCSSDGCSTLIRYGDVICVEFDRLLLDVVGEKADELGSLALSSGHN